MFVHTGDNGILISMNDKKQLVEAMTQIAEDDTFSQQISKRAIKIRDELQALTIAEKWLSIM